MIADIVDFRKDPVLMNQGFSQIRWLKAECAVMEDYPAASCGECARYCGSRTVQGPGLEGDMR